jgi:hypothetical protein
MDDKQKNSQGFGFGIPKPNPECRWKTQHSSQKNIQTSSKMNTTHKFDVGIPKQTPECRWGMQSAPQICKHPPFQMNNLQKPNKQVKLPSELTKTPEFLMREKLWMENKGNHEKLTAEFKEMDRHRLFRPIDSLSVNEHDELVRYWNLPYLIKCATNKTKNAEKLMYQTTKFMTQ